MIPSLPTSAPSSYLLRVEAVNLLGVVADTEQLSTIRGGGLMLLHAMDEVKAALVALVGADAVQAISTGASIGLFQLTTADWQAARAAARARLQVPPFQHATFLIELVPFDPSKPDGLLVAAEEVLALVRWRQQQTRSLVMPPPGVNGVCALDRTRPTTTTIFYPAGQETPVSTSVRDRYCYGRQQKQRLYRNVVGAERFDVSTQGAGTENVDDKFVFDLQTLTAHPDAPHPLHGKMAVLYVDGNSFSETQKDFVHNGTLPASHADGPDNAVTRQIFFDSQLRAWRSDLMAAWVEGLAQPEERTKKPGNAQIRMETLLWGGDEMLLVVPAWKGWWAAALLADSIRNAQKHDPQRWRIGGKTLQHGIGLVFCHHDAPINGIRKLAQRLADDIAKRQRKQTRLAYLVLESFDLVGRDLPAYWNDIHGPFADSMALPAVAFDDDAVAPWRDVEAAFQTLSKHKLPRRRLHRFADIALNHSAANRAAAAKMLLRDLQDDQLKAIIGALCTLAKAWQLNGPKSPEEPGDAQLWLHVHALWDYLAPHEAEQAA
jgi:hypothetical protein